MLSYIAIGVFALSTSLLQTEFSTLNPCKHAIVECYTGLFYTEDHVFQEHQLHKKPKLQTKGHT